MNQVLLIHENETIAGDIQRALAGSSLQLVQHVRSLHEAMASVKSSAASVFMLHARLPDGNALNLIPVISQLKLGAGVILLLDGNESPEFWQQILLTGVRAVLAPPFTQENISMAAARSMAAYAAPAGAAQTPTAPAQTKAFTVSVTSARSGVGNTVLVANLAAAITRWQKKVCLLDITCNAGDISMILDDVPRNTIVNVINAGGQIDHEFLETVLAVHPLGFRYLAAPSQDFDPATLTGEIALDIIQKAKGLAEYCLIDAGRLPNPAAAAALAESDLIFVITTRDVIRLSATQRYLARLSESKVDPQKIKVIVNSAEVGTEIPDAEVESILEHPVSAYLPHEAGACTYSVNTGKPIVIHDPSQNLAAVLIKMSELIVNHWKIIDKKTSQSMAPMKAHLAVPSRRLTGLLFAAKPKVQTPRVVSAMPNPAG